jgi:hypothetical protein
MNLRGACKPLERLKKSFRGTRREFDGHTRIKEHKAPITERFDDIFNGSLSRYYKISFRDTRIL